MRNEYWIMSGQAHEAARSLAWLVVIIIVGIGIAIWWDMRNDK